MTNNLIFQVIDDCDTVLVTRSESKAYQVALRSDEAWIVAMEIDSIPCKEYVYDVTDFAKEYMV